jgi:hypothetical protein
MQERLRIAWIGIGALALVAGLWLILRAPQSAPAVSADAGVVRDDPAATPADLRTPPEPIAARDSVEVAADTIPAAQVDGASEGLRILSSSGLELPFVDWRGEGGDWRRVTLEDGRPLEALDAPCEVRAPGHVASELEVEVFELTLEPDALFTLRAPELRRCTRSIDVDDPFLLPSDHGTSKDHRRPEVAVWGFLSDSEWAVALSPESVLRELRHPELRIEIGMRDARRVDAVVRASSGSRWSWDVPCADTVAGAPLEITIERLADEASGSVRLFVGTNGTRNVVSEGQTWGTVHRYPVGYFGETREVAAHSDEFEFERVPLGLPTTLVAQDSSTMAYGRTLFVHDGTPQRVTLRPPLRVTGRLLDQRDRAPLERASIVWACRVDGKGAFGWRAEAFDAELASTGSFALAGPMTPPGNSDMPLEPPGSLWVRIEAPGFEALELDRELGDAREIDLGEVLLVPRTPEMVLAPGHGLVPRQVTWNSFEIAGQPGHWWEVRWGRLAEDGALELHFGDEERDRARPPPDWSTARALILYVQDDDIPVRAFERDPEGRYAAVEMDRHELVFQVEPSASERIWRIGWEWNGLFAVCTGVSRPAPGDAVYVAFSAPLSAQLAWVGEERGQRGARQPTDLVPLTDAMPVLVLR